MIKYREFTRISLRFKAVCLFLVGLIGQGFCQQGDYHPPVDIPIYLSGNFGELRGTHFHAGIDIKTGGVVGHKVFSVERGYVSRVKVQSGGYGKALYIAHPNGETTVYGHLNEYFPELDAYVKKLQYKQRSFEVNQYLGPGDFPVEKGQLVAYSGNTGRSGGPHLHFEIRHSKTQVPRNGLFYGFNVKDTIPPKFRKLVVYNFTDSTCIEVKSKNIHNVYKGRDGLYRTREVLKVSEFFAFGIEVYDYLNYSNNKCGVYSLQLEKEGHVEYAFEIDELSFSETGYIKSHMDLEERHLNKRNVHKLFLEPNNKLSIYYEGSAGYQEIRDSSMLQFVVIASDASKNTSTLLLDVEGIEEKKDLIAQTPSSHDIFNYRHNNRYESDEIKLIIPANALYNDLRFQASKLPQDSVYCSDIHFLAGAYIPLHKKAKLYIKPNKELNGLPRNKLLIARLDQDSKIKPLGGVWQDEWVRTDIGQFGKFVVMADTVPPHIKPNGFIKEKLYRAGDTISFYVRDELSGIKTYNGYIDGRWVLFEYDAKSDRIHYTVDPDRLEKGKVHELKIYVMDERNNMSVYESEFRY